MEECMDVWSPEKRREIKPKVCLWKAEAKQGEHMWATYQQLRAENTLLWGVGERLWVCRRGI